MAVKLPIGLTKNGHTKLALRNAARVAFPSHRRAPNWAPLRKITHEGVVLEHHIREGRFQRSLSLIAAFSSLLSGLEVTYEHYTGAHSSPDDKALAM